MSTVSDAPASPRTRDPRLDFFRGMGMCIILIAHIPWNPWTNWIPARFGFSDAADMFVFCSGMASAIAFGRVFAQHGWLIGTFRILHRLWQVYWVHICAFVTVLTLAIALDHGLNVDHYVREELKLQPVLDDPRTYLVNLLTLRFVPNYFDILPMYLVVLAMTPVAMALALVSPALVGVASLGLWLGAQAGVLELTADASTGRPWFFNPFAWQLLFFTGFAFARGWLPAPPRDRRLALAAVALVLVGIPLGCQNEFQCYAGFGAFPALGEAHEALGPLIAKTNLGPLRYLHFVATAYLAFLAVGEGGRRLSGRVPDVLRMIGKQTLAVFLTGLVIAQGLGAILDVVGRSPISALLVNLAGQVILLIAALIVTAVKSPPWRKPPVPDRRTSAHAAARPAQGAQVTQTAAPG